MAAPHPQPCRRRPGAGDDETDTSSTPESTQGEAKDEEWIISGHRASLRYCAQQLHGTTPTTPPLTQVALTLLDSCSREIGYGPPDVAGTGQPSERQ